MDEPKKRRRWKRLDEDAISKMDVDRKAAIVAFRIHIVQILRDTIMLLHTLEPLKEGEELQLDMMSDCGMVVEVILRMRDRGTCDPETLETLEARLALVQAAEARIDALGRGALHMIDNAPGQDPAERLKERVTKRRSVSKTHQKSLDTVESLIDDVLAKRRPKKGPPKGGNSTVPAPPKSNLGFLD